MFLPTHCAESGWRASTTPLDVTNPRRIPDGRGMSWNAWSIQAISSAATITPMTRPCGSTNRFENGRTQRPLKRPYNGSPMMDRVEATASRK
ncbi:hypothetical protein D3C84_861050 [compost metagenome]